MLKEALLNGQIQYDTKKIQKSTLLVYHLVITKYCFETILLWQILGAIDILQLPTIDEFQDVYVMFKHYTRYIVSIYLRAYSIFKIMLGYL